MSRINNYEELIADQKRVENKISEQRLAINEGINDLKEKLQPFLYLLPILNIFRRPQGNNSFLKAATSLGIDLVGQTFLSKANWITKLIVPLFFKGFSNRAFSEQENKTEQASN